MSLATASSFNQNVGSLRARGNSDEEFAKAMKDRLTMLQYQAPSELKAKAGQIEGRGQATSMGLKSVSDAKGTIEKGVKAYQDVKAVGQQAVSAVGDLAGRVKSATDQAGKVVSNAQTAISNLSDPSNLRDATTRVTTKTKTPQAPTVPTETPQGEAGPAPTQSVSQRVTPLADTQVDKSALPDLGGLGDGSYESVDKGIAKLGDNAGATIQKAYAQMGRGIVRGAGGPSDALNRSRNVFSGVNAGGGKNAMNQLHNLGGEGNNVLSDAYNSISKTRGLTGGVPSVATNVHTNFNDALGDMKSQMGGALDAINTHLGNLSGQVAKVGEGVGETAQGVANVGKDVMATGSKVISGVTAGFETAGAVADALGPIGDLVGLGMAIFGGVEDSKVHKEDQEANKSAQAQVQAPVQGNTSQSANVSLDTAQKAQVGAISHY